MVTASAQGGRGPVYAEQALSFGPLDGPGLARVSAGGGADGLHAMRVQRRRDEPHPVPVGVPGAARTVSTNVRTSATVSGIPSSASRAWLVSAPRLRAERRRGSCR